jgi:hypothetical protein
MPHLLAKPDDLGPIETIGVIVMDESGSMARFGDTPPSAIEAYLAELRASPDAPGMAASIVTFSSAPRVRVPLCPVAATPRRIDWHPGSGTRLYGSAHDVLASLLAHRAGFRMAVVTVLTDGEDNRSSEARRLALVGLAAQARALGWELLTFGVGVDAGSIARAMGFPDDPAHARSVDAVEEEVARSIRCSSQLTLVTAASMRPPR